MSHKDPSPRRPSTPQATAPEIQADGEQSPPLSSFADAPAEDNTAPSPTGERLNRRVLVGLLIVLGILFVPMLKMFFVPFVLASTFVTLFYPLYRWLRKRFGGRRGISSLVCCLTLLLGLLVPTYVLVHLVANQGIYLYKTAAPKVREIVEEGEAGLIGKVKRAPIVRRLRLDKLDWQSAVQQIASTAGKLGTILINKTSAGVLGLFSTVLIMLISMFYLFMDGEELMRRLEYLSPLRTEYEQMLTSRFLLISRASIRGTLLVGLVQGTIGALTLLIFGVHTWLLWGFVMVLLSIIPMVGAWLVLIPAGVIQIVLGNTWQGIGIILVNVVVVSNLDNILRPRLVGRDAKLHDLVILFSTLGGIAVFGVMGFIVGPVLAALFVTLLDMYGMEYADDLKASMTSDQDPPAVSPASGIEPQSDSFAQGEQPSPAPVTEQSGQDGENAEQETS